MVELLSARRRGRAHGVPLVELELGDQHRAIAAAGVLAGVLLVGLGDRACSPACPWSSSATATLMSARPSVCLHHVAADRCRGRARRCAPGRAQARRPPR